MKASALRGKPVVNLENAEKLGEVSDILIDTASQRIVALELKGASSTFGGTVPVETVHAVGKDAITVTGGNGDRATRVRVGSENMDRLKGDEIVPLSKMLGAKVLSEGGNLLGTVDELDVDPQGFQVLGYEMAGEGLSRFTGDRKSLEVSRGVRYANGILIVPEEGRTMDYDLRDSDRPEDFREVDRTEFGLPPSENPDRDRAA